MRDLSNCTREQLEKQIHLLEMSNSGLQASLKKHKGISKGRLLRLKKAKAKIADLVRYGPDGKY